MDGIDPDTLLEWLQTGIGDERDLQLMALEQLCMLLLMADNIDRCFESCPPRTFLPALCKIFLDETAPDNVLEVTARAITYYLDVSNECTRRITQVDGAVKAICNRLAAAEMTDRSSKDLAEQCVKLLEHVCQRETLAVYDAGGIHAMLTLVRQHGNHVHKDTMHSAMSVVTRLCGKMEPNDAALPQCAESLGALLSHEDSKVSESALRCFAALTDRFIRKSLDPMELAKHSNLVSHLLETLCASETPSVAFVSIVLSLLSNLCRGSAEVTQQILSNEKLIPALFAVLTGRDERCVTDGLRLADLLVVLLCEGRNALPKNCPVAESGGAGTGSVERAHRHLIDAIRQKDTQALVDAVESGSVDVNYTDDVGQTLLNWAAAFGSPDMVVFLCDRGADVNKGNKSSSLHYAACFGRPDIVKMLLQRGANPDLRDEDGKTALDKARERSDEDHAQVAAILESPSVYMHAAAKKDEPMEVSTSSQQSSSDLPDRTLAAHVLRKLVPVFCEIFHKSLNGGVRRSSLSLLRKSIQHMTADDLRAATLEQPDSGEATETRSFAESLVSVLVAVLDQDEEVDAQEQVLMVMSSLLQKDSGVWVEELIRLGVFEKVESMAKEPVAPSSATTTTSAELRESNEDINARNSALSRSTSSTPSVAFESDIERMTPGVTEGERAQMLNVPIEDDLTSTQTPPPTVEVVVAPEDRIMSKDATEIQAGTLYRWKEWRIVRSGDSLFIWADPLAFEFSFASNGWFRYLMDGTLWTMYSNGNSDSGASDSQSESRKAFVARWRRAVAACGDGIPVAVLQIPNATRKVEVPNWELFCARSPELSVRCTKLGPDANPVVIKDEQAGFVFETVEHVKHSINSESVLAAEFSTGWAQHGAGGRRARFRAEMQRKRVQELAWEVWDKHLKEARAKPREALLQLQKATQVINECVKKALASQHRIELIREVTEALNCVKESVLDDRRLSTFELSVSGLVPALVGLLTLVETKPASFPAVMFKEAFGTGAALSALARKMVLILEAAEKFPQYLYDTPGGSAFGLQLLSRRLRMKLDHAGAETEAQKHLLNRTNRILKSEPLTSVGQLKGFLLKMVAKQWYDRERETYAFVKQVGDDKELSFVYTSDFDDQGIIYWLGTNGRTVTDWTNPASIGVVKITCSDTPRQPFGRPDDVLSRDVQPCNCHSSDDKNAHFTIDMGCQIMPSAYSLRHARGYGRSALRNWLFQGSRDQQVWEVLVAHSDDTSLGDPGSTATWPIEPGKGPFRYFRVAQNGKNSSGQTYYLSISGFEIYGKLSGVVVDGFKSIKEASEEKASSGTSAPDRAGEDGNDSVSGRIRKLIRKERKAVTRIPSAVTAAQIAARREHRLKTSDEVKSPVAAVEVEAMIAQGANNNRLKFGLSSDQIYKSIKSQRIRTTRSRILGRNSGEQELRGTIVKRGPDWQWAEQDGGNGREGRVVSNEQTGWIDVLWDNGYTNSYRFGYEGRFDVQRTSSATAAPPKPSSGASELLSAMRSLQSRARNTAGDNTSSAVRDSPFSAFAGFSPFGLRPPKGGKATPISRFRGSATPGQSSSTAAASSAGSAIGKKSMSTTNLVEERPSTGPTVASTGQAASAESLQHQTPSLENLLARSASSGVGVGAEEGGLDPVPEDPEASQSKSSRRRNRKRKISRVYTDRIAESRDEDAGRDTPVAPEEQRSGSSQPTLSVSSSQSSVISTSTPAQRENQPTPPAQASPATSSSLSVSAPDLAAARQRQQSSDTFEMDKTLEEEDAEGDDDNDEDDDDDDEEDEDEEEENDENDDDNENEENEEDHEERDEDKSGSSYSDLLAEFRNAVTRGSASSTGGTSANGRGEASGGAASGRGERGLFERIREVIGMEESLDQLLTAATGESSSSTSGGATSGNPAAVLAGNPSSSTTGGPGSTTGSDVSTTGGSRKSSTSTKSRFATYTDVLKSVMQQMIDPGSAMEVDEIDEDEIFDDEADANEDDLMDDELSHLVNVPVDAFASMLGRGGEGHLRLNWRQMSQLLMGDAAHRLLDPSRKAANRVNLRQWDDEFVLKCQFQALIPAFDPRPGRTNVNQTQDVELPAVVMEPGTSSSRPTMTSDTELRLFLRGPNLPGVENVTIEMDQDDWSLFKCVQKLVNNIEWQQKGDRSRRIWDPTYTLIYEDAAAPSTVEVTQIADEASKVPEIVNQTLDVLGLLSHVGSSLPDSELPSNVFVSEKLMQKLTQELSDPLVVAARSMPDWCERLVYSYPCLFSMDTRSIYMHATAFGVSRSIVWLQSRRDAAVERSRGSSTGGAASSAARREDAYEFRVGRLKHERIKVTRCEDQLLEQAVRVFRFHADRKAVLEIEYNGEEGTGLGPTLEFYALVAAEMQRKALAIWWCDDLDETQLKMEEKELDLGEGKKPPGFYVRRAAGLFPAPLPPNTDERRRASELFRVLGIFLAKVLQDGRLVDIPLSQPFLKLAVHANVSALEQPDLAGVLTLDDFEEVHPVKGRFLKELSSLAARKRTIECDTTLDSIAKRRRIDELTLNFNGTRCKIEDLALNFTVNPPSAVFQFKEMELIEGGADVDVTTDNVELYVEKCTDFYLNSGIVDQVRAFREGFDRVFPLQALSAFTPDEVQCLVSGEQCPEWTREDVLNYTEPKLGYTRDSPGFLRFVDVMVGLSPSERKSFLQFATGCSSLPPGGLANLHPRLTVVRKVESGDGSYPSVNTCVHYLKLPEYSSAEILRERLLTAVNEKGFHLN